MRVISCARMSQLRLTHPVCAPTLNYTRPQQLFYPLYESRSCLYICAVFFTYFCHHFLFGHHFHQVTSAVRIPVIGNICHQLGCIFWPKKDCTCLYDLQLKSAFLWSMDWVGENLFKGLQCAVLKYSSLFNHNIPQSHVR